jgi:hypothetical protein
MRGARAQPAVSADDDQSAHAKTRMSISNAEALEWRLNAGTDVARLASMM